MAAGSPSNRPGDKTGKLAIVVSLIFWAVLTGLSATKYPASGLVYLIFSTIFLLLLISGFFQRGSYSYFFLVLFLWLGFWFKFSIHLLVDYPFVEPVGDFYGAGYPWYRATWIAPVSYSMGEKLAWDNVLWVGIVGAVAVIAGRAVCWRKKNDLEGLRSDRAHVPRWYPSARVSLWVGLLFVIVSLALLNAALGIQQAGLVPRTVLPWPLNALTSWIVSIGSAMGIATLLHWDIALRRSATFAFYAVLFEAFASTVSLLSRAVYIFHVLPQLMALLLNRKLPNGIGGRGAVVFGLVAACLFVISIGAVTALRSDFYWRVLQSDAAISAPGNGSIKQSENATTQNTSPRLQILESAIAEISTTIKAGKNQDMQLQKLLQEKSRLTSDIATDGTSGRSYDDTLSGTVLKGGAKIAGSIKTVISNILQLAADRWIGIEGVMAVQSHGPKNIDLLLNAITEKREVGRITSYQKISNSLYAEMDTTKNQFASLPGAMGFFLVGGSLWLVATGMFGLTLLLLLSERAIFAVTGNPFLCALVGLTMANTVAQLGAAPRQNLPYFSMIILGVLAIWLLQSEFFLKMLKKIGLCRNHS